MADDAAFECNGVPVQRQDFYAVACDPRRSVAVEACAGAGKTWMLVSRVVRALLDGCAAHEILAITFTKKAAGEMRQRLQEWLLQFAGQDDAALRAELLQRGFVGEPTQDQLQRLRNLHPVLLQAGRPVQIRTFHSWFAALLRHAPLQALADLGLPAHYELLENDARAVALVWPRFQARLTRDPDARQDYLHSVATLGRHQSQRALEAALSKRVEFGLADTHGVVDHSVKPFGEQFPRFSGLATPQAGLVAATTQSLLWEAARLLGAAKQATAIGAAQALERALTAFDPAAIADSLLTKSGSPRKFSDKLIGIETVRLAQEQLQAVAAAQLQHEAWLHQGRMARLTRLLVTEYGQLKREQRWIDMGDLEYAALALMSDPVLSGWVQERLDARVRHLLIDEFQDTNPLQWQALGAWLSGYGGAGQAPSVFVVGDPKQSIYRFRRAEPQVFKAAQHFVREALGGDLLSCDHTRRNAPAITSLVNTVMAQAQALGEYDGFRTHSTESKSPGQVLCLPTIGRTAAGDKADASVPIWRDSLAQARHVEEETRKVLECRQAAAWLAVQLQSGALQPRDIMVLARKRERLVLMQAELTALGVASQQPEKSDLADFVEVQDVVSLVDALVSTRHDLSLARALKSPLFGVSDADLVQLVLRLRSLHAAAPPTSIDDAESTAPERDTPPSWWQVLMAHAASLPPALQDAAITLARWQHWVQTLVPHDALSAIYHDGDVLARFGAASPTPQRDSVMANLRALLGAAMQIDGGRYTTAYSFVRSVRAGGIQAPVRAQADAVRLLTIHGAKGLEAPLVLVLDTDGEATKAQTMGVLLDWPGESAYPLRFVFLASESRPPACVVDAMAAEQSARLREELNALYVAMTRAQHTLVISSMQPHIANPASWSKRLQAHAVPTPALVAPDCAPSVDATDIPSFHLTCLQNVPLAPVKQDDIAIKIVANDGFTTGDDAPDESLQSRRGQAMHRLLEHYRRSPSGAPVEAGFVPVWQERVAVEFALPASEVALALAAAQRIVGGPAAWAWDSSVLAWQGNEVALVHEGRLLRIDRLVQRKGDAASAGQWWVLDYKSNLQPHMQPLLRAQLAAYRAAVLQAYPGQTVRAAFLSAQGQFIELEFT